jgi:hypothetical protein
MARYFKKTREKRKRKRRTGGKKERTSHGHVTYPSEKKKKNSLMHSRAERTLSTW